MWKTTWNFVYIAPTTPLALPSGAEMFMDSSYSYSLGP